MTRTMSEQERAVRWGWADVAACFGFALVVSALAFSVYLAVNDLPADFDTNDLSITATVLLQIPLWVGYLGGPIVATLRRGNGPVADLLLHHRWRDVPVGIAVGVACQFVLVPLVSLPIFVFSDVDQAELEEAARSVSDRAQGLGGALLLILLVVVMAPLAEEVFFRGLLQQTLRRSFARTALSARAQVIGTVVLNGLAFGASHFQPLQFPALTVLGIGLAYAVHRTGRLPLAIWIHVGFNLTTVVVLLAER